MSFLKLPILRFRDVFRLNWSYKTIHLTKGLVEYAFKNTFTPLTQYTILQVANVTVTITIPDL